MDLVEQQHKGIFCSPGWGMHECGEGDGWDVPAGSQWKTGKTCPLHQPQGIENNTCQLIRLLNGGHNTSFFPNLMLTMSTYRVALHPSYLWRVCSLISKERSILRLSPKQLSSWRHAVGGAKESWACACRLLTSTEIDVVLQKFWPQTFKLYSSQYSVEYDCPVSLLNNAFSWSFRNILFFHSLHTIELEIVW